MLEREVRPWQPWQPPKTYLDDQIDAVRSGRWQPHSAVGDEIDWLWACHQNEVRRAAADLDEVIETVRRLYPDYSTTSNYAPLPPLHQEKTS